MTPAADFDLLAPLRRYWGYDSFRPLQERIVRSLLTGNDIAVVMPTGGGKSLCYQLPALVLGRTVIVVSPLIALMQDQAAQLAQMGIPAAVLNSSQPQSEQSRVIQRARLGEYRLLYLSPERLARSDTIGWLRQIPLAFFAIDEAHCISEWGHEFRPEYRQLSALREHFPETPIAAFTASATQRVRHDILHQLQLREPHKYIVSFHRPNLRYFLRKVDGKEQLQLLVKALRTYSGSTVIVYAPTIATVEDTVDLLADRGIRAVPYHGKMTTENRQRNQERWMSDEVRILVGTLAFGLGINKPAVRAVIHLSLPKSIEQYYQEAGRAGRDGEPADCVMLWRKKDSALHAYFIQQLQDPGEIDRSWQRYREVKGFAESKGCRHRQICVHFGEKPKWERCGMCDVCGNEPGWLLVQEHETVKPKPLPRREVKGSPAPQPEVDSELREFLKEWRRKTAQRAGVAAFLVFSDATLDDLCRKKPSSTSELLRVTGIGEKKAEQFGREIFAALEAFQRGARAEVKAEAKTSPASETLALLEQGRTFQEIAETRGRQVSTVIGMVADLVEKGLLEFRPAWVSQEKRERIEEAAGRLGVQWLKPLREALPPEITADEIRLVIASMRRASASAP